MSQIKKRSISDHDTQVLANVGSAILKTGVTAAALVGSGPEAAVGVALAYELTGVIVESQRQKMCALAQKFAKRTSEISPENQDIIRERLNTEEGNRIFETAWRQAAEEVDPEKLDLIARLLKNSLSAKVLEEHQVRWLLKLLDGLDIVQIVILQSFSEKYKNDTVFRDQHSAIFAHSNHPDYPQFVPSRQYSSFVYGFQPKTEEEKLTFEKDQSEYQREIDSYYNEEFPRLTEEYEINREKHALYKNRVDSLIDAGLLGAKRERGFSDYPDRVSEDLTPLGAALLKITDSISSSEWGCAEQLNSVQALQQSLIDIKKERASIFENW